MSEDKHIIWSNYDLDYEDWRGDLETEYPELSEDERISLMYEINGHYLDDERMNLDVQLSQPILVVGDLGLWYDIRKSPAATSGTACIPTQIIPPGMWTGWAICGATPFTMTAPTIIFIEFIRTVCEIPRSNF